MTIFVILVIVVAGLWLGSRGKRPGIQATARERADPTASAARRDRDAPAAASPPASVVPSRQRPMSTPPVGTAPDLGLSSTRAVPARPATAWMLSKRGLCSPDPHP